MTVGLYYSRGTVQASVDDIAYALFAFQIIVSSPYTLTNLDFSIYVSVAATINFPASVAGIIGRIYIVTTNQNTTLAANGTDKFILVDGTSSGSVSLTPAGRRQSMMFQSDGAGNWLELNRNF